MIVFENVLRRLAVSALVALVMFGAAAPAMAQAAPVVQSEQRPAVP
jgi:hypothetical protein